VDTGEIIEQYPDDYPYPSTLILGFADALALHIVIGVGNGNTWLVTAYYPDEDKWENDFKTRKAVRK